MLAPEDAIVILSAKLLQGDCNHMASSPVSPLPVTKEQDDSIQNAQTKK